MDHPCPEKPCSRFGSFPLTLAGLAMLMTALPGAVQAGEPYCAIEQSCRQTPDSCETAAGRVVIALVDGGKAEVRLNETVMGRGAVLTMQETTTLLFTTEDGVQNQLRIQADGAFTYLVSRPDAAAFNGKDQVLYRGQCVEG